jgi:serine/threonine protein phosphatase 1
VPLPDQSDRDCLWIRKTFLNSDADHGAMVVHGHSITDRPEIRDNRIGIDTGAYRSGVLTCLVLDGEARSFLQTASP